MDKPKRKIEIEDRRVSAAAETENLLIEETAAAIPGGVSEAAVQTEAGDESTNWADRAAEHLELAQRKEAELRNYMRRVQKDIADARRFAVEGLLADLFPVLDGLAQVAQNYKDRPEGDDPVLDGLRVTLKGLRAALAKHGIEPIDAKDVPYDSHLHQALNVEESADVTEETVAEVYVEGWKMGEMVLKPALVRVVKPSS